MNKKFILLVLVFFLGACSHAPARKAETPTGPIGPPAPVYGPDQPYGPDAPTKGPVFGPDFKAERPVVLVLGPGMARGYAYTGVIRALSDAKIRIGAIYGTEMGALIGSLYALTGSVNKLEWGVQRFRDDVFESDEGLLSKLVSQDRADKLDAALERVFDNRDLSETKIPMHVLAQVGRDVIVFDSGKIRSLVRAALGDVNGLPVGTLRGGPASSAGAMRPFDVKDAKALGIGPVIAVDVLDPKESDLFPELKDADLILRPEMKGISKVDFKKRTDAVFSGKAVTQDHLDEIKHLTGGATP